MTDDQPHSETDSTGGSGEPRSDEISANHERTDGDDMDDEKMDSDDMDDEKMDSDDMDSDDMDGDDMDGEMNGGDMGEMEPGEMMLNHPLREPWIQYPIIVLGVWLLFSPPTLGYESQWLAASDIVSGLVLIGLSGLVLFGDNPWASYANGFVGLWLLMAPLVFQAPTAAGYLNDTLVGIMVITFSIIVMMRMEMSGAAVPSGWSYNPSTAAQRAPLIVLGLFGFFVSRYMAAYQLGHIGAVWDPVFGDGTRRILDSRISAAFPVSDAGLGAVAYAIEALMGFMGDKSRWRTMPWMVAFFGIVVIPLGFVQVLLVILQPIAVGTWCTLCLLSAFGMLWMISLTVDEVVAMGQLLRRRMHEGVSLWHAFWMGGELSEEDAGLTGGTRGPGTGRGDRGVQADGGSSGGREGPPKRGSPASPGERADRDRPAGMFWGVSVPWPLVGAMALGFWIMLSPTVFGSTGLLADSSHLVGALVVSVAVIATGEPARALRFVNVPFGLWIVLAPVVFGAPLAPTLNGVVVGALLVLVSIPRGTIRDEYGSWWEQYIV